MTITRVVQDGIEFFTINATGIGAISESGVARLCGIKQQSINEIVQKTVTGKGTSECLKHLAGKDFRLQANVEGSSVFTRLTLIRSDYVAALIEYYAFESRHKTEEALYAYRKFAKMGVERWIQDITGWVDPKTIPVEPPPLPDLNLPRYALDRLRSPNVLSSNGYRLYLQLHDADIRNLRPTAAEICKSLKIALPTYNKALKLLDHLSLLPSWVVTKTRRQPERLVRDWLQEQIGGQAEAPSPDGPIDLLTDEEVVEVKAIHNWKEGIGHVLVKAQNYPDRHKCLLLFGEADSNIAQIQKRCDEFDIQLGFVPIQYGYDTDTEEVQIRLLE